VAPQIRLLVSVSRGPLAALTDSGCGPLPPVGSQLLSVGLPTGLSALAKLEIQMLSSPSTATAQEAAALEGRTSEIVRRPVAAL